MFDHADLLIFIPFHFRQEHKEHKLNIFIRLIFCTKMDKTYFSFYILFMMFGLCLDNCLVKAKIRIVKILYLSGLQCDYCYLGHLKKTGQSDCRTRTSEIQPKLIEPITSRRKTTVKTQKFRIIHCSYPTVI